MPRPGFPSGTVGHAYIAIPCHDKQSIVTYLQDYEEYLKKYDLDPLNPEGTKRFGDGTTENQWYGRLAYYSELACWYAMANPDAALTTYFDVTPEVEGERVSHHPLYKVDTRRELGSNDLPFSVTSLHTVTQTHLGPTQPSRT